VYIEIHDKLGRPQRLEVTRVVAYDSHGNPCALALSYEQNGLAEQIIASSLGQADFQPLLQNMGINRTVIIQDLEQRPLPSISF
jgi:hypothetical protein